MTAQPNPYAPPKAEVSDATDVEVVEPASRWKRFLGALVDGLIGIGVSMPVLIVILPAYARGGWDPSALSGNVSVSELLVALGLTTALWIAWLVVTIVFVVRNSQTIGKKIVGTKVVRADGSRAGIGRIFWLRNFVNGIPAAIPLVGYVYVLVDHLFIFGSKRQCVHDKIADTIVVKA